MISEKGKLYLGVVFIAILTLAAIIADHFALWPFAEIRSNRPVYLNQRTGLSNPADGSVDQSLSLSSIAEASTVPYAVETVASGLEVPWSIVFAGEDRLLVSERPGTVREIVGGRLNAQPIHRFEEVSSAGEAGLMGMISDPNYRQNQFIYACYAYSVGENMFAKVVRLKDGGSFFSGETLLIDRIPAARNHAGCELGFGPDGKLYITAGDASERALAQDRNSLEGKLLRINPDGTIPSDNPFADSPIWSYGHRNAQGIDWYPGTDILFSTEHGPSGFDGPGGGDEINIIEKGANYGWPVVSHENSQEGMKDPEVVFTPAVAPASAVFYDSNVIPAFKNNLFFGLLRGQGIMRVVVNPDDPRQILMYERLPEIDVGRIREVIVGPDGYLYFTTSNRDGRAPEREGDDHIFRLVPLD